MKTVKTISKCNRFEETINLETAFEILTKSNDYKTMKFTELKKMVRKGNVTISLLNLNLFFQA